MLKVCSTEWSFLSLPPYIFSATFTFHVPYSDLLGAQGQEETLLLASRSLPETPHVPPKIIKWVVDGLDIVSYSNPHP